MDLANKGLLLCIEVFEKCVHWPYNLSAILDV